MKNKESFHGFIPRLFGTPCNLDCFKRNIKSCLQLSWVMYMFSDFLFVAPFVECEKDYFPKVFLCEQWRGQTLYKPRLPVCDLHILLLSSTMIRPLYCTCTNGMEINLNLNLNLSRRQGATKTADKSTTCMFLGALFVNWPYWCHLPAI